MEGVRGLRNMRTHPLFGTSQHANRCASQIKKDTNGEERYNNTTIGPGSMNSAGIQVPDLANLHPGKGGATVNPFISNTQNNRMNRYIAGTCMVIH